MVNVCNCHEGVSAVTFILLHIPRCGIEESNIWNLPEELPANRDNCTTDSSKVMELGI